MTPTIKMSGLLSSLLQVVFGTTVEQIAKQDLGPTRSHIVGSEFEKTKKELEKLTLLSDQQKDFVARASQNQVRGFDGLSEAISLLIDALTQLQQFSSSSPLPGGMSFAQQQQSLTDRFVDANTRFYVEFSRVIQPFIAHESTDASTLSVVKSPELKALLSYLPQIEKLLAAKEAVATKQVTVPLENRFTTLADAKYKEGYAWLVSTAVFLGVVIWLILDLLGQADRFLQVLKAAGDLAIYEFAYGAILRILLFAALTFALVKSANLYQACKHQRASLLLRATALSHVDTVGQAALDPDVRKAVLLEATKAIYSPGETGYERDRTGSGNVNVTELITGSLKE